MMGAQGTGTCLTNMLTAGQSPCVMSHVVQKKISKKFVLFGILSYLYNSRQCAAF